MRSIKVVADGALGSRGAWLLEPYADEPGTRGLNTVDPAAFQRLLAEATRRGFQVATHAIGDAANRFVLDAYEKAFAGKDGSAYRFRVEHAQILDARDIPRFAALGVIASMQPTHATSDMPWVPSRLGAQRTAEGAYVWQKLMKSGAIVASGSDFPVESANPSTSERSAPTRFGWIDAGFIKTRSAAAPATCGVAALVPLKRPDAYHGSRTFDGATISGFERPGSKAVGPQLE